MNTPELLKFNPGHVVALVGAGGKTSLLYHISNSLLSISKQFRLLITTTTHMHPPSGDHIAEQWGIYAKYEEALEAVRSIPEGSRIVIGTSRTDKGKLVSVPPSWPRELVKDADLACALVEADGSRNLPFKAPASHEPVYPENTNTVIAVVGVDAVGVPLDEKHVCRAKVVAEHTNLSEGECVGVDQICRVMGDRSIWKVPSSASFYVCVNKVDGEESLEKGRSIAKGIMELWGDDVEGVLLSRYGEVIDCVKH